MNDILFDLETIIKKFLGLVPSVEVEAKKPEPEKIEPVEQQEQPATESVEQSPKPQPAKEYPPYSPMSRTKYGEERPI